MGLWGSIKKIGKGAIKVGAGYFGGPGGYAAADGILSGEVSGKQAQDAVVARTLAALDAKDPIAGAWARVEIARSNGAPPQEITRLKQNAEALQRTKDAVGRLGNSRGDTGGVFGAGFDTKTLVIPVLIIAAALFMRAKK